MTWPKMALQRSAAPLGSRTVQETFHATVAAGARRPAAVTGLGR